MRAPFHPEVFGDFLLVQRLDERPGMDVMLAVRLGDRSGRAFVLKRPVLGERPSGRAAQAIQREAEVLEAARSPRLPALGAAGDIAGLPYIALEYVRGVPLDALLEQARLPPGAVKAIAVDLGEATSALRRAGWVHGGISSARVIVDDTGEVTLCDLGGARRVGERPGEALPKEDAAAIEAMLSTCAPHGDAPVDRSALAGLVEQAIAARAGPPIVTPTAPMAVPVAAAPTAPTAVPVPAAPVKPARPAPTVVERRAAPPPTPPRGRARGAALIVGALLVGVVAGRLSTRIPLRHPLLLRLHDRIAP